MERLKCLVLQHVDRESPGRLQEVASGQGIDFEITNFTNLLRFPNVNVKEYQGLVVLGGPMGVNDSLKEFPSKECELEIIKSALAEKIPIMGKCLGAELLASALGGKVYPNQYQGELAREIGFYSDVEPTEDGINDPIDIVAKKKIDGKEQVYFVEVKSGRIKTDQIAAHVELAERFNVVPVLCLVNPPCIHDKAFNEIVNPLIERFPKLLIWDKYGRNLFQDSKPEADLTPAAA